MKRYFALRWLLFVTTPFVILIALPLMVGDYEPTVWDLAGLGSVLLMWVFFLGAGRYTDLFDPAPLTPFSPHDLQSIVLEIISLLKLGRLPLARDLQRLHGANVIWYSEVDFSRAIILTYGIVFGVGCLAILLGVLTTWLGMSLGICTLLVFYSCTRSAVVRRYAEIDPELMRIQQRIQWYGCCELLGLFCLTTVAIVWRIHGTQTRLKVIGASIVILALLFFLLRAREGMVASAFYANVVAAEVIGPLVLAWFVSTVPLLASWALDVGIGWYTHNDRSYEFERRERNARDGRPVAIALSGGGYRAALIHAGVLRVLDEAKVPVRYVSAVSGGSVVGGAYALGWTPQDFAEGLIQRRPGFANETFSLLFGGLHLWHPDWSMTNTLSFHLERRYFHWHLLDEPLSPMLILNATKYSDGRRHAFWAGQGTSTKLAAAVAASGAFPGAFDPITIGGESYLDGGIVENLGLEGLRLFFEHAQNSEAALPSALIISDASRSPDEFNERRKVFFWESAYRAIDLSRQAVHRWLYDLYTDRAYDRVGACPGRQPFWIDAGSVWRGRSGRIAVFVLDATSPAERCRFVGREEEIARVGGIPSIKELSRTEAELAFWAGQTIALAYVSEICGAADKECALFPGRAGMGPTR